MPLLNATAENIKDLKIAVAVTFADDDAPIFEDNPPGVGKVRVKSLVDLLDAGPTWKPMKSSADLPAGRGVLLRSTETPFGAPVRSPEGRVEWMMHLGYRGAKAGVWVGGAYYPDRGAEITSAVFTHWADAPAFDGE